MGSAVAVTMRNVAAVAVGTRIADDETTGMAAAVGKVKMAVAWNAKTAAAEVGVEGAVA